MTKYDCAMALVGVAGVATLFIYSMIRSEQTIPVQPTQPTAYAAPTPTANPDVYEYETLDETMAKVDVSAENNTLRELMVKHRLDYAIPPWTDVQCVLNHIKATNVISENYRLYPEFSDNILRRIAIMPLQPNQNLNPVRRELDSYVRKSCFNFFGNTG